MIHVWCTVCKKFVTTEPAEEHELHRDKLVGIRHDILVEEMDRMVWALRTTGRLEPIAK